MKFVNKTLALAVLVSASGAVWAQSADDQVLNSAPIDVDGYLHEKPVTDGELETIKQEYGKQKTMTTLNKEKSKELGKLSGQTEKLLDSQDEYIDSKIESQKAIKEFNQKSAENEKKLRCLMEESTSKECEKYVKNRRQEPEVADVVTTAAAAPVVTAPAPISQPDLSRPFEEIKFIAGAGVTNFQGQSEKLETSFAGALRMESNVNERLSIGVGLNYAQFSTQDYGGNYNNMVYGSGYYNAYGSAREIGYKSMGLDLYGKLFITRGERFRPYVGGGLGYNRMTLNYNDNSSFNGGYGYNFGDESLTSSYATGKIMGGTEVLITRTIGLNLELSYARGFGSGNTNNGVNPYNAPDQQRLQDLSKDIINANALSIFGGLIVVF